MRAPAGFHKVIRSWQIPTNITSTQIFARVYIPEESIVLGARVTPVAAGVDFTTTDETYVVSVEDNTTKISTDNAAITALNKTGPIEAPVAQANRRIVAGHYLTVTLTLGGTTPIVPALSTVELETIEP